MSQPFDLASVTPLTPEDIVSFESRIGRELPSDYKVFLTNYHGAELTKKVAKDDVSYTVISSLFTMSKICEYLDDNTATMTFRQHQMLPFCDDVFGNLFCLALNNDDLGQVFFYNHETAEFSFITDCFGHFLQSLIDEAVHLQKVITEDEDFAKRLEQLRKNSRFKSGN